MGGSFTGTLIGITLAVSIVAPLVPAITGKAAILLRHRHQLVRRNGLQAKGREATASSLPAAHAVASTKLCYLTGGADLVLAWACCKRLPASAAHGWNTPCKILPSRMLYTFMSVGLVMLIPSKVDRQALRATLQTQVSGTRAR